MSSYTVQSGDTLFLISQRYGVSLNALVVSNPQLNGSTLIIPGQVLQIQKATSGDPAPPSPPSTIRSYTVASGDTLWQISQKFGISLIALEAANPQLNGSTLIFAGSILTIPPATDGTAAHPPSTSQTYTVTAGDTLYLISQRYNVTLAALIAANPQLNGSTVLSIGSILNLPAAAVLQPTPITPPAGPASVGVKKHYSGPASSFPDPSLWRPLSEIWARNLSDLQYNNSPSEIAAIQSSVTTVAASSGVDARVILCIIMQESAGNVRVRTTNNGVRNPGLMQSHNGVEFDPQDPDGSILQMIRDGTEGTQFGDGLKQCIARHSNVYTGLREYNSGSVNQQDLSDGLGATADYVSDVANRLLCAP